MTTGFRYEFDSIEFGERTKILRKDGQEVALRPQAALLLLVFLRRPGELLGREELLNEAWGGAFVHTRNLDVQLTAIRQALETRPDGQVYIENRPRRGFQFVAQVRKLPTDPEIVAVEKEVPESISLPVQPDRATLSENALPRKRYRPPWRVLLSLAALMLVLLLFALLFPRDAAPRLWVDQYAPLTHDGRMKGQGCVLTNGSHVYFWEDGPEGPTLEEVPVSGGESKALALQSGFVEIFDLSSKTSEFLVGSSTSDPDGHMLWTVSSRGGAP